MSTSKMSVSGLLAKVGLPCFNIQWRDGARKSEIKIFYPLPSESAIFLLRGRG
jgi:hypothetical protein